MFKRWVYLKSGAVYRLKNVDECSFNAKDLTDDTVHKFVLKSGKTLIAQGGSISHFIIKRDVLWFAPWK